MIEHDSIDYPRFTRTDNFSETVFLWVVDPKNPSNPIDIRGEGKHYLSINPCIIDTSKKPPEHILHMEHDT
jgi:hypothetical protein